MRKKGCSILEISKLSQIPKSTVRLWCKEIILSDFQKARLKKKHLTKATQTILKVQTDRKIFLERNKKHLIKSGKEDLIKNKCDPLFFLALGLYWGEGYKKGNMEVAITNSDPRILNTTIKFLHKFYSVQSSDLKARLTINSIYKKKVQEIINFWSKETGIPNSSFTKTHLVTAPFKRKYKDNSHKGTLRIKVLKPLNIRERLLSSINNAEEYIKSI